MKLKKAAVAALAMMTMLLSPCAAASAETTYICGNLLYTVKDNSITITAYNGKDSEVTVPNMIAGDPVNVIAEGAFAQNENVIKVNLPDTIMTVEEGAFGAGQTAVFADNSAKGDTKPVKPTPAPTPVISTDPAPVISADPTPITAVTPDPVPTYPTEQTTSEPDRTPTTGTVSTTTGSGGYTVTYAPEPAYYPATTVTEKKVKLKISARTDSKGNVILEWDKVKKADKYTVYILSGRKWSKVGDTERNSFTFKGAQSGKTCKFMVRYHIGGQTSGVNESFRITVEVQKEHSKPTKPIVTVSVKNGKVTLSWDAVPNAQKYAVYRVSDGKLRKVTTTTETFLQIKPKPTDSGYAVKACINGRWTSVSAEDIVTAK